MPHLNTSLFDKTDVKTLFFSQFPFEFKRTKYIGKRLKQFTKLSSTEKISENKTFVFEN